LSILAGYLGLVSLFLWPVGLLALPVSIWAIADLKKRPESIGMGRAVFGVIGGAIGVIGSLFLLGTAVT
jgi:hypothetical protein